MIEVQNTEPVYICGICKQVLADPHEICPTCKLQQREISVQIQDSVTGYDELGYKAQNPEGKAVREGQSRQEKGKESWIDVDRTGPAEIVRRSGTIEGKLNNLQDENAYTAAFAEALNKQLGTSYLPEAKKEEDSDFPDIWLIPQENNEPNEKNRIGVQVTHFDYSAIAGLGKKKEFSIATDFAAFTKGVVTAIGAKQHVDHAEASKTYLLLICPYPIIETMQEPLKASVAKSCDQNIYRETWIAPFKEPPFRVQ